LKKQVRGLRDALVKDINHIADTPHDDQDHQNSENLDRKPYDPVQDAKGWVLVFQVQIVAGLVW
jgi:hypothetical protein